MTSRQLILNLPTQVRSGRADFLPGATNAAALAMISSTAEWPEGGLLLTGPSGSGRSHLLRIWTTDSGAIPLRPQTLCDGLAGALRSGRPVAVDDSDGVAGHPDREEALFHLLNHARAAALPVLLVARDTPGTWGLALPDLESRLQTLAVTRTEQPDDALLSMVLVKLCDDRQLSVTPEVLQYLVPRMDRSLATARRLTATLDRIAVTEQRPVTRAVAARALAETQGVPPAPTDTGDCA
jgi:chromosomal replication initiation ATPase DnaA